MFNVLLMGVLAAAASPVMDALPNKPVAVDVARYTGTWHEIAHLPMYFQRQCVDNITANYTPGPESTLVVRNTCRNQSGKMDESVGVARPLGGVSGALKVRFAPAWLSWLPMVWADYWVVDLDTDYQWAVVGGPSRKYLWVLSRQPDMDRALFEGIKARAAQHGYPVDHLKMAAPLR